MRRWLVLIAGLAGLASLIAHLPLCWVLPGALAQQGVTASGTVWNGQLGGVPLVGSLSVGTTLSGVRLLSAPGPVTLRARIKPGAVSDAALSMPIAALPLQDARLAGLAGRVSLRIDAAEFDGDACLSASGTAASDVLRSNAPRLGWAGPELAGPIDCVDGRVRVRLSGEDAGTTVDALTTTGADGLYQSDITVRSADPAAGNALVLCGFTPAGANEYRLSEQGRWR